MSATNLGKKRIHHEVPAKDLSHEALICDPKLVPTELLRSLLKAILKLKFTAEKYPEIRDSITDKKGRLRYDMKAVLVVEKHVMVALKEKGEYDGEIPAKPLLGLWKPDLEWAELRVDFFLGDEHVDFKESIAWPTGVAGKILLKYEDEDDAHPGNAPWGIFHLDMVYVLYNLWKTMSIIRGMWLCVPHMVHKKVKASFSLTPVFERVEVRTTTAKEKEEEEEDPIEKMPLAEGAGPSTA